MIQHGSVFDLTPTPEPSDRIPPSRTYPPVGRRNRADAMVGLLRMMSLPGWWKGAAMVRLAEARIAEAHGELTRRDAHLRAAASHEGRAAACTQSESEPSSRPH
jgi:hypothetical protein